MKMKIFCILLVLYISFVFSQDFDFKWSEKTPKPWVNTKPIPVIEIDPEKDTAESAFKKLRSQMREPLSERCAERKKESLEDMYYQLRERAVKNKWTVYADPSDYLDEYLKNGDKIPDDLPPAWPQEFFEEAAARDAAKQRGEEEEDLEIR